MLYSCKLEPVLELAVYLDRHFLSGISPSLVLSVDVDTMEIRFLTAVLDDPLAVLLWDLDESVRGVPLVFRESPLSASRWPCGVLEDVSLRFRLLLLWCDEVVEPEDRWRLWCLEDAERDDTTEDWEELARRWESWSMAWTASILEELDRDMRDS
jgi:hypothetical protein